MNEPSPSVSSIVICNLILLDQLHGVILGTENNSKPQVHRGQKREVARSSNPLKRIASFEFTVRRDHSNYEELLLECMRNMNRDAWQPEQCLHTFVARKMRSEWRPLAGVSYFCFCRVGSSNILGVTTWPPRRFLPCPWSRRSRRCCT